MTSTVLSVGLVLWGLFMIGGATWAVYAGRRDRAAEPGTDGDSEDGDLEAGTTGGTDEEPAGPQLGGYLAAGLIILLGIGVVAVGVYTLL